MRVWLGHANRFYVLTFMVTYMIMRLVCHAFWLHCPSVKKSSHFQRIICGSQYFDKGSIFGCVFCCDHSACCSMRVWLVTCVIASLKLVTCNHFCCVDSSSVLVGLFVATFV